MPHDNDLNGPAGAMRSPVRTLAEECFHRESFHDCHVTSLTWDSRGDSFSLLMDYIAEWLEPTPGETALRYRVAPAVWTFEGVVSVAISAEWSRCALEMQIACIDVVAQQHGPNGTLTKDYEIDFSEPDALIKVRCIGYRLDLLREPEESPAMLLARTSPDEAR